MPTSKGDPFLKTGIILVSFKLVGKIPVSNDLLMTSKDMGIEISCIRRLRILTGMLLGPVDLEGEKEPIILMTSSGEVGHLVFIWRSTSQNICVGDFSLT